MSHEDRIPLIRERADCRAIYRRFFPALFIEGKEHSRCAFHEDRGPSLKLDERSCYCFGACKRPYDVIDLYAKGADCTKAEAIDLLARELGISSDNGNGSRQEGRGSAVTPSKRRDYAREFDQALQTQPPQEALDYLERRGLTSILPMLLEKKLIGFKAASGDYQASIVLPAMDLDRKVLGLQYVPCDGGEKKFASGTDPGTYKNRAFLPIYSGNFPNVIVEGGINAFTVMSAGLTPPVNAIAIFSAGFVEKVSQFRNDDEPPTFFFDRDAAGEKATAEAVKILRSRCKAVDWSQAPEGCNDVNDLLVQGHTNLIEKMIKDAPVCKIAPSEDGEGSSQEWETPSVLASAIPPAPPFPLESLPHRAANYANDEAQRMQSPIDLIAIPMIVTFAGLIGKDATIRPKRYDDWSERPCLWAAIIAPPAAMKSQNQSRGTAPLRRIQSQQDKEDKEDKELLADWQKMKDNADLREDAWEKECNRILKGDQDAELPPKPQAVQELPPKPGVRRILTNDATIEKHADLMCTSRGMTLARDELAGFLLNMSRYNAGSDRQFYLECYSGGSYAVDRVTKGEQWIDDLYLNIVGGIQPEVAQKLLSTENGNHDGFFERFGLTVYPEPTKGYTHTDRRPNKQMRELFNEACDKLASADWAELLEIDEYSPKPYAHFDDEAQSIFDDWLVDHMLQIKALNDGNPICGMMGKARGLLVRLTLVLHLAAWAGDETPNLGCPKRAKNTQIRSPVFVTREKPPKTRCGGPRARNPEGQKPGNGSGLFWTPYPKPQGYH